MYKKIVLNCLIFCLLSALVSEGFAAENPSVIDEIQSAEKPVKKSVKNKTKTPQNKNQDEFSNIEIESELLEYFPEKYEVVATDNVKIRMSNGNAVFYADRVIYNTDKNTIKGYGNVKIVKEDRVIEGDFAQVNLNDENILVDNPSTEDSMIVLTAQEGYVYSDRIENKNGVLRLKEGSDIELFTPSMYNFYIPEENSKEVSKDVASEKNFYEKIESLSNKNFHLKVNKIYIISKKEHDEVILENAGYYYKNTRIMTIPRLELVTDKEQSFVETSLSELGSFREFGTYFGHGGVLNLPKGSTLKLLPVIQVDSYEGSTKLGFGAMGRFKSKNNITEALWGSTRKKAIVRGRHKLGKNLHLEYGHNAYMDEWFMGLRMPEYIAQLVYDKTSYVKDLDLTFRNKLMAGYVSDYKREFATSRFRWQTETSKTFGSKWNAAEDIGINFGLTAQTSATVYGTGDFNGVVRGGPFITSRVKNWKQTITYYQGAQAGESPLLFDRYMYGKSNLYLLETIKLCKYLSFGYLGSYALLKDNWENKFVQESRFFVTVGPENSKIALGYDPIRKRTQFNYIITLKDDGMNIPYEEMIIKNPDTFGKKSKGKAKKEENL